MKLKVLLAHSTVSAKCWCLSFSDESFPYNQHASKDGIRAVILCPTRELADQTTRECKKMAKGNKFYIKLMTKELARNSDFSKRPCDILISTPLRLRLAIRKKKVDLSRCVWWIYSYFVLTNSKRLVETGNQCVQLMILVPKWANEFEMNDKTS